MLSEISSELNLRRLLPSLQIPDGTLSIDLYMPVESVLALRYVGLLEPWLEIGERKDKELLVGTAAERCKCTLTSFQEVEVVRMKCKPISLIPCKIVGL
jgi:hypothetical protein